MPLSEKIALFGIIIFIPLVFIKGILPALLVLIYCAVFALNLQLFDYRRLYTGLTATLMGICVGAAQSKSGGYIGYFFLYAPLVALVLTHAFIAQQMHIYTCASTEVNRPWRASAQAGVIVLLLVCASVIYLILPRLPAGNLGGHAGSGTFYRDTGWEDQAQQQSGLEDASLENALRQLPRQSADATDKSAPPTPNNDELDLSGATNGSVTGNAIIAYMTADQPLYLRTHILDMFDGVYWSASSTANLKLKVSSDGLILRKSSNPSPVRYTIELTARLKNAIPLAAVPSKLLFPATAVSIDSFGQMAASGPLEKGTRYSAESVQTHLQGRIFSEMQWQHQGQYTQLPADLDPRIAQLANQITANSASQLAAAVALETHLRSHYSYDLTSVFTSQGATPLANFLFVDRHGHCEYFASALAIMLRTQNIPARLVRGFSATQQNPLTGFYEIRVLDGHAWVEAFVDNVGWVQLEPTAYFELPRVDATPLSAELINRYVERQQLTRASLKDTKFSFEGAMLAAWQKSVTFITISLAYGKLFFIQTWLGWLLAAVFTIIGYGLWLKLKPRWQLQQIFHSTSARAKKFPAQSLDIYLQGIEEIWALTGKQRAPGETIERYTGNLKHYFATLNTQQMCHHFNATHYHPAAGASALTNAGSEDYRFLLSQMYQLGYNKLKALHLHDESSAQSHTH